MHELSIAQAILDHVEMRAEGRPVRRVQVRVGHLRQVVPDSLLFSWEMVTTGTALDGAELVVHHVPAVIGCRGCGASTTLELPVMVCGACGSHAVDVQTGEELDLAWVDVAEEVR